MQTDPSLQKFGYGLGMVGGIALSFDIPLIRLAQADAFTVMFVRGAGLALILFLFGHFVTLTNLSVVTFVARCYDAGNELFVFDMSLEEGSPFEMMSVFKNIHHMIDQAQESN